MICTLRLTAVFENLSHSYFLRLDCLFAEFQSEPIKLIEVILHLFQSVVEAWILDSIFILKTQLHSLMELVKHVL